MFFIGNFEHALDAKGRTSIPARWRELLTEQFDERLILTPEGDRCLLVHPYLSWIQFLERLRSLPKTSPAVRAYRRRYVGQAQEASVDAQGRLLLPPTLRDSANLKSRVVLVGNDEHFEIWDPKKWAEELERPAEDLESLDKEIAALELEKTRG